MTLVEFAGSWGWYLLLAFFLLGVYLEKFGIVLLSIVAVVATAYFAGFNPPYPKGPVMETAIAFVLGVLAGGWGIVIFVALLCGIFPLVEREREWWAFLLVFLSAVMLYCVTGWNLLLFILYYPYVVIPAFVVYLAAGFPWALYMKWPRFVEKAVERMRDAEVEFIKEWIKNLKNDLEDWKTQGKSGGRHGMIDARDTLGWKGKDRETLRKDSVELKTRMLATLEGGKIPDELIEEWHNGDAGKQVRVLQNKERFLNWVMFWPWSALSYFLFDFIAEVLEKVWRRLISRLQAVMDEKYASVDQRLIKKPSFGQ